MTCTLRLASYAPKGKEQQAMKQQKAMLIALIVICITVVVTVLVTRKDLCRYESEPARRRSLSSQLTNLRVRDPARRNPSPGLMSGILNAPALTPFRQTLFFLAFWFTIRTSA